MVLCGVAGCKQQAVAPAAPPEPQLEIARERLLPLGDRDHRPLFGPDGSITVGTTRFAKDGHRGPRSHGAIAGQLHPVAVIGTAAHPETVSIAWTDYPHPSGGEVQSNGGWLIVGDPDAGKPTYIPTGIDFANESSDEAGTAIELSPDRTAVVAIEHASDAQPESRDALVVRNLPSGKVLAHVVAPASQRACWIDAHRIAWRDAPTGFAVLDVTSNAVTHVVAPDGDVVACAAGGGSAALATPTGLAVIDLATGRTRGTIAFPDLARETSRAADAAAQPPRDRFALGRDGCDVAILRGHTFTVLRCEPLGTTTWYRTTLVRALSPTARPPTRLEFSPDARRLALVGDTIVMFETGAVRHAPPALPAMAELPPAFVRVESSLGPYDAWSYAQLGAPTGLASLPALITHAQRDTDDPANVMTIAMEPDALSVAPLPSDASDAAIQAYALAVMPELVEQWRNAEVGTDRDAEFTLKVGHRDGKPFFETREAWRDGCEPYDGYTQVVIDRDLLFVTRALVVPAASTNPWLQAFFDVPFQRRTQLARRRGPETGPC